MKSLTLSIPACDGAEFASLPDDVRAEVRRWQNALAPVIGAKRIGPAIAMAAARMGCSPGTARRKWDAWNLAHDWRVFVNKSKCPVAAATLPAEFVEYWKGLCERNQRKCKPAHRELIRIYRSGAQIPGYEADDLPRNRKGDLPESWSYRNLVRHKPSRFELTAARIGRKAAADFRPLVFTTRADLYVGAFYLFDDIWHDLMVHVPGQRAPRRPLEFHALDLFSARKFAWGIKPSLEREDGTSERLKEAEMRFLLAQVLQRDGFSPRGTTLVVEHGTAAIRGDLEALISDLSGGLIKIARSGIEGASAFAGQYGGAGKGNFRFKAALESLGNLIHNETANLLGQTGSNSRLNAPEELHGRTRAYTALAKAMLALPPERADLLRLPFLRIDQFQLLAAEIYQRINDRTEHELEGWEEAGLLVSEFRLDKDFPWQCASSALQLDDQQRAALAVVANRPGHARVRRMSPNEVWEAGRGNLQPLAPHAIALILGQDLGVERKVRSGLFEFQDREAGPGTFRYLARLADGRLLRDGESYLTLCNPHAPELLHLLDARGRYVGACPRWESISRGDAEALHRQCGRAASIEKELLSPIAQRGAALTRQRIEDAEHNADVLRGAPVTPLEQSEAAESRRNARGISLDDFLPSEAEATPAPLDLGSFLKTGAAAAANGDRPENATTAFTAFL